MITLSTFQAHLSTTEPVPPLHSQTLNDQEHDFLRLLTALPSQAETQQAEYLERMLTMLLEADIDESQRLQLTATVIESANKLIANLRLYYIYETGALSDVQLQHVAQVQSLYYQIIMIYDGVIRRNLHRSDRGKLSKPIKSRGWQRYFTFEKSNSVMLATVIYQMLLMYQKLLAEEVLCYRKPDLYLWSKINQLYHLAYQQHAVTIDVSAHTTTKRAKTIHQLYCQLCLHSLLNLRAMRRPHILLVQRLLPEWAEHMVATIEPKTETRVFVDLRSDHPPSYLTATSQINPYEDCYECLFIELAPMLDYFTLRKQALVKNSGEGTEYWLLNKISMAIDYRYLQSPLSDTKQGAQNTKSPQSAKKTAVLITGFNNIHYRVSHPHSFISLMAIKELPEAQHPHYDTVSKKQDSQGLAIETGDDVHNSHNAQALSFVFGDKDVTSTAPPPVQLMSLFLVCQSDHSMPADWSIGVARWLNLDATTPDVEWQLLGHKLVACGLRLEGREARSQRFVPALVLGRDEQQQALGSLIVPTSYFQTDDKVVMRINNKQNVLRLGRRMLVTDEFSQYEVAQL